MKNFLYAVRPLAVDFLGMIAFAILIALLAWFDIIGGSVM